MSEPLSIAPEQELVIDVAVPTDAEPICRVTAETWIDTYPNADLGITRDMIGVRHYESDGGLSRSKVASTLDVLQNPSDRFTIYVARLGEEVVGVSANKIKDSGQHLLNTLYLLPAFQQRGIGTQLLKKSLEWHDRNDTHLKVATYNQRAIRLYEKFGFVTVGPVAEEEQFQFQNGTVLPEVEMVRRAIT